MKLNRTRYYTMNSWNNSTAPAFNLKVHHVIPAHLRSKVFEMMECENFYWPISDLVGEFGREHDYEWQAGFNGRSGGYLVLYRGGKKPSYKSRCTACGQRNFKTVEETGKKCGKCGAEARENRDCYYVFTQPGLGIADDEVPEDVMKSFEKLAHDIVELVLDWVLHSEVTEEEIMVPKTRKVLVDA